MTQVNPNFNRILGEAFEQKRLIDLVYEKENQVEQLQKEWFEAHIELVKLREDLKKFEESMLKL